MTPLTTAKKIVKALEDLKGEQIVRLDVRKLTSITDFMIIASGRSNRQVRAMADRVIEFAKQHDLPLLGSEGQELGEWVLVDLGDVIVHLMQPSIRDYYQLERLWDIDQAPALAERSGT